MSERRVLQVQDTGQYLGMIIPLAMIDVRGPQWAAMRVGGSVAHVFRYRANARRWLVGYPIEPEKRIQMAHALLCDETNVLAALTNSEKRIQGCETLTQGWLEQLLEREGREPGTGAIKCWVGDEELLDAVDAQGRNASRERDEVAGLGVVGQIKPDTVAVVLRLNGGSLSSSAARALEKFHDETGVLVLILEDGTTLEAVLSRDDVKRRLVGDPTLEVQMVATEEHLEAAIQAAANEPKRRLARKGDTGKWRRPLGPAPGRGAPDKRPTEDTDIRVTDDQKEGDKTVRVLPKSAPPDTATSPKAVPAEQVELDA